MKVYIDGSLVFDDDIEKGCGNQVFDYGQTIPLGDDDSPDDHKSNGNHGNGPARLNFNTKVADEEDEDGFQTPNIDKVDLFKSIDTDRPSTRVMTDADRKVKRPVVGVSADSSMPVIKASSQSSKSSTRSSSDKPKGRYYHFRKQMFTLII